MVNKRDVVVSVKMSREDLALLESGKKRLWPGAIMSRSSMVLSLARMAAEAALKKKRSHTPPGW